MLLQPRSVLQLRAPDGHNSLQQPCIGLPILQALPLFLDRLADPITAVIVSVTVVLIFGEP